MQGRPVRHPALRGTTRASVNKRPYMRILENTRSSIRSGRGNCGKRKTLWYVMIFQNQRQKIFVAKVGILCGYFRDKSLLSDQNSRKAGFLLSRGHESCRCGIFRGGFRWKSHESCPQGFVEDFGRIFFVNRVWKGFSTCPHPFLTC